VRGARERGEKREKRQSCVIEFIFVRVGEEEEEQEEKARAV
jgi:hypothetical protein